MKILQINSVCGYGSTGRIASDLFKVIESNGHDCCIAYGRGSASNEIKTIKIGNNFEVYSHVAITRLFDRHGFASKKATEEFVRNAKEYDPDIIHLHNIHGYYINIKVLFDYLKYANKPVIWTLHDCWPFTGHCYNFDIVCCSKWKRNCSNCPNKVEYPRSILVDSSKRNFIDKCDIFTSYKNITFVTPSKWLAGILKDSYLKDYNVKVIPNGIDLNTFRPLKGDFRERYFIEGKFIVLGVASVWDNRKGLNTFVELSKILNSDYQIVLVGVTDKQKKALPSNIICINRTNSVQELAEIYSAADVFLNPTLEDNFPTTNIEALACGTPVITFDTGGSPESIDEKSGFIVGKGDVSQIIEILKRKQFLKSISKTSISRSKLYDKNERFLDYIKLYENAINYKSMYLEDTYENSSR